MAYIYCWGHNDSSSSCTLVFIMKRRSFLKALLAIPLVGMMPDLSFLAPKEVAFIYSVPEGREVAFWFSYIEGPNNEILQGTLTTQWEEV